MPTTWFECRRCRTRFEDPAPNRAYSSGIVCPHCEAEGEQGVCFRVTVTSSLRKRFDTVERAIAIYTMQNNVMSRLESVLRRLAIWRRYDVQADSNSIIVNGDRWCVGNPGQNEELAMLLGNARDDIAFLGELCEVFSKGLDTLRDKPQGCGTLDGQRILGGKSDVADS